MSLIQEYIKAGWVLHPLSKPDDKGTSPGKKPLLYGWQKLTKTPDDLERKVEQGYNVGLVCGEASNVTVIDFDSNLFIHEIQEGSCFETLSSSRTEGRGHIYYKYNPKLRAVKHHDMGIEILSNGSNAAIPPSKHELGSIYKWKEGFKEPAEMPAQIEENLINLFKRKKELFRYINQCRPCFRKYWNEENKVIHGSDTRLFLGSFCSELHHKGAKFEHIRMFAKLLYREKYDEERTLSEYNGWTEGGFAPWTCEKLQEQCMAFADCETCPYTLKKQGTKPLKKDVVVFDKVTDISHSEHTDLGVALLHKDNIINRFVFPSFRKQKGDWMEFKNGVWSDDENRNIYNNEFTKIINYYSSKVYGYRQALIDLQKDNGFEDGVKDSKEGKALLLKVKYYTEIFNNLQSLKKYTSVNEVSKGLTGLSVSNNMLDWDTWLFNVNNGSLDMKSGELKAHEPEDYCTFKSPVDYDVSATCPAFMEFLDTTFGGNADIIKYMQKRLGYALIGEVNGEGFDIWYGLGNNGKSVLLNIVNYVLEGYSHPLPVESIEKTTIKTGGAGVSPDIMALRGKRFVTISEASPYWELNEGKIKSLSSREEITGRNPFENPQSFIPSYVLVIIANHKPYIAGKDKGIWRRIRLINFKNTIKDADVDEFLADRICETEGAGVLNWLIKGCLLAQIEGIVPPLEIINDSNDYRYDSDPLSEFLENILMADEDLQVWLKNDASLKPIVSNKLLYAFYLAWCRVNNILKFENHITFKKGMESRGFVQMPRSGRGVIWGNMMLNPKMCVGYDYTEAQSMEALVQMCVGCWLENKELSYIENENEVCKFNGENLHNLHNKHADSGYNLHRTYIEPTEPTQKNIVIYLKQNYDMIVKPKATSRKEYDKELDKVKELMEREIDAEFEGVVSQESSKRIIEEYCKSREW